MSDHYTFTLRYSHTLFFTQAEWGVFLEYFFLLILCTNHFHFLNFTPSDSCHILFKRGKNTWEMLYSLILSMKIEVNQLLWWIYFFRCEREKKYLPFIVVVVFVFFVRIRTLFKVLWHKQVIACTNGTHNCFVLFFIVLITVTHLLHTQSTNPSVHIMVFFYNEITINLLLLNATVNGACAAYDWLLHRRHPLVFLTQTHSAPV